MVRQRLEESGINRDFPLLGVKIIRGFFCDSLPDFPENPIAFLHIDADLYPGYHDALVNLFPKIAVGGIVAFDEYKRFPPRPEYGNGAIEKWPAFTRAVNEYLLNRPEQLQTDIEAGKYYAINASHSRVVAM